MRPSKARMAPPVPSDTAEINGVSKPHPSSQGKRFLKKIVPPSPQWRAPSGPSRCPRRKTLGESAENQSQSRQKTSSPPSAAATALGSSASRDDRLPLAPSVLQSR